MAKQKLEKLDDEVRELLLELIHEKVEYLGMENEWGTLKAWVRFDDGKKAMLKLWNGLQRSDMTPGKRDKALTAFISSFKASLK